MSLSRDRSDLQKAAAAFQTYGIRNTWYKVRRNLLFRTLKPRLLRAPLFTEEELNRQRNRQFPKEICFSIIVPLYNTPEGFLREMIQSVLAQTYPSWQLCLGDGSSSEFAYVEAVCQEYAAKDCRILYRKLPENYGISGNTNACLEMATGNYIALFDHDDLLHPAALHQVMEEICRSGADYIYTDEVIFEGNIANTGTLHCKSEFSVDTLRANNYICHFSVFSRQILEKTGAFRKEYDGSQDHDFILRATGNAKKIAHIPQVLYYWRSHPNSVAKSISSKSYAIDAGICAVQDHLKRNGIDAAVENSPELPAIYRIHYPVIGTPKVSVITAVQNASAIHKLADMVLHSTAYPNYEWILAGDSKTICSALQGLDNTRIRIADAHGGSQEAMRNVGAAQADGDFLLFLDENCCGLSSGWIEEMLPFAQRSNVGAVGAKIADRSGAILHSGLILGYGGEILGCPFRGTAADDDGYMGKLFYPQEYTAVSGECLMIRKDLFLTTGGFDDSFCGTLAAADLCLRLRKMEKSAIWTPHAQIIIRPKHGRQNTRTQCSCFQQKWTAELSSGDPCYSSGAISYLEDFLGKRSSVL